jgi:chromosome segregation ATPase
MDNDIEYHVPTRDNPLIMRLIRHISSCLLLLPALMVSSSAFGERMYKWVDENGQVHYSNQLPPEASQRKREVINDQGRTVKVYQAPLTPEEKIEEKQLAELELKKKELAQKRANHDRSLLATYSSKKDMYPVRDAKISAIESLIKVTSNRIQSMQNRLLKLTEEAADYERSGKQLPASLLSQISNLRKQIERNKEFVDDKNREIEDIKHQFESDIRRYEELTSGKMDAGDGEKQLTALEIAIKNPNLKLDRHDRTLLATYATEDDLIFARNQEIENINSSIGTSSNLLDTMQNQLSELSDNASEYQDRNEIPPDLLLSKMKQLINEIDSTQTLLEQKRKEKQVIVEKFTNDINRYKELIASPP